MPSIPVLMNTVLKPLGISNSGSGTSVGLLLILTYP